MIGIGSTVRVKPPFDEAYPDTYEVLAHNDVANGWTLDLGGVLSDVDETYLEEAA